MEFEASQYNPLGRRLFVLGFGAYVAMLPVNWLSLGSVGGLEVRPTYVAAVLMLLSALSLRWRGSLSVFSLPIVRGFGYAFACYLALLTSSMFTGEFHPAGLALIVKQAASFAIFLVTVELLADSPLSEPEVGRLIYISSAIGIVLFIIAAYVVFAIQGQNLFVEYFGAIARGDAAALRMGLYRTLLSAQENASDVNVSMVNGLSGAFCAIYYLLLAFSAPTVASGNSSGDSSVMLAIKWGGIGTCALIVLTSLSRSNILVLLIGTAVGLLPSFRMSSMRGLILLTLVSPLLLLGTALFTEKLVEIVDRMFISRFQDLSEDGRIGMFSSAISEVASAKSWWMGAGVGSKVDYVTNEMQIHNLFLASWFEAGIPALVFAVIFYLILVWVWVNLILRRRDDWWPFECSPVWLAALLTLPLIRMMIGGQGGNMGINDWFAVAFVLGVYGSAKNLYDGDIDDDLNDDDEDDEDGEEDADEGEDQDELEVGEFDADQPRRSFNNL